ncbi:MAG: hypothetical protein IPP08_05585 [Chlorobiota bacterium]|nr:MAG: hypothetical protein IPP08_05585 [Chlorobiota bacterium]
MNTVYALIWRTPDETFKQEEFDIRIPRLMEWLKYLKSNGHLLACGGGGFETESGGLTIISADSLEHAEKLSSMSPMNEIGKTEIFIWDTFYSNYIFLEHKDKIS